jgi:DNA-binding winged helix-turn-helix (wHTH) protein/tetratricopeptide (TPR) repeat protein
MKPRIAYRFGRYRLSPATREFRSDGEAIAVPARVFDCMAYLIEHRARAVGRDELGAAIWGKADISEAQLTQTILRARRLLDESAGDQNYIRTVPRFGYHWTAAVRVETEIESETDDAATGTDADPAAEAVAVDDGPRPDVAVPARPTEPERRPKRFARIALVALAILAAAVAIVWTWRLRAPLPTPALPAVAAHGAIVLPIERSGSDEHAWVRLGAIDVIASRLRAAGLAVPPTETTLALLDGGGGHDTASLLRGAGTHWVVSGRADRSALGWRVALQATDGAGTQHLASTEAQDLLAALRDATDALLKQLGLTPATLPPRDAATEDVLQRAQAAMLENDFQAARRILTEALSSSAKQSELRYQLATLAFRAGRLDDAERELHRLLEDESGSGDVQRTAQIHYGLGAIAMMRDRADVAEQEFGQSLAVLDRRRHPLDYGKALGGRGGARLTLGRYQQGFDDLGEARTLLEQSGDRLALARMNLVFGMSQLLHDRVAQSIPVLTAALAQLEPFGAINERAHGYSALCNAQLELLDYVAAARTNEAAWALLARIKDPLNRAETLSDRVALLLIDGRYGETTPVVADLDALDLAAHPRLDGRRDSLHAELAWKQGDLAAALARAEAAIGKLQAHEPDAAARMVLLRQRALLASGRRAQATAALAAAAPADGNLLIGLRVARAELAAAGPAPDDAEREFAAALADAEARALPAQTLRVAEAMLPYLLARGQVDAASAILGRLAPTAEQDFDAVLLQVRVHQASGRVQAWADALRRARTLAGERRIPAELQQVPTAFEPPARGADEPSR